MDVEFRVTSGRGDEFAHGSAGDGDSRDRVPTPVGRRVADLAFEDRKNQLNIDELASRAATSVRTASRLFPVETGLTLKSWRQRARIVQAMDLLERGNGIARVSAEFGFASTASFSCAFRQVTAMTPTMFLGDAN